MFFCTNASMVDIRCTEPVMPLFTPVTKWKNNQRNILTVQYYDGPQ